MSYSNENKKTALFLTFIFPFAGLIYSLSRWREGWAKNAFWLACVYLGSVFVFQPDGAALGGAADGGDYVLYLIGMHNDSSLSISQLLSGYLKEERLMDLYQQILTYLISRFTDNGHVLFCAFAVVFGFFYSRNIWYVLEKLPNKKLGNLVVIVALFFLVCPITQINGVRMWTALHVLVYGMMPYLFERDKSKIWWVIITPLIHFSYLYVVVFALLYVYMPKWLKTKANVFLTVYYLFFIITLFINTLRIDAVGNMLAEYSPESFENRINMYVNEDVANKTSGLLAQVNWYVSASRVITYWGYNLLLLVMLPCIKRYFRNDASVVSFYSFTLLLGGIANIMALIPSGGRFQLLSQMFKVPLILYVAMNVPSSDSFRKILNFTILLLIIPFVFDIRQMLDYFSITAFLGNFVTVFFWENNVPIITLIKRFI